jgi:hypothetical protein
MRRIVFEHFAAQHDDLRTLRNDAEGRTCGGVRGLGRQARSADGIGPRKAERKYVIVRSVPREPGGQFSQPRYARRLNCDGLK